MLLIYHRVVLSLKSSLLRKHVLIQLLDSQETNVQLMKTPKLRMQPHSVKNLPQFSFQGSLLTKVWNYIDEEPNFFTCFNKLFFWLI